MIKTKAHRVSPAAASAPPVLTAETKRTGCKQRALSELRQNQTLGDRSGYRVGAITDIELPGGVL